MDIDVSNRYIATVSGERRLNVFQIDTGKNVRSYKSDTPEEVNTQDQGSLIKISLDPGGVHAVTGGSDKSIRLFDFSNGNILGKMLGHSELITGVKFTPDCERIISTSADGCIFVWKVSNELATKMRQKWLDRSGVLGQSMEKGSLYLSPTQTPPSSQPRMTMPAQKPQSIMMDLQASDGRDPDFTVRKGPLKAKKSLGSLTPADLQTEDSKKPKRPASFSNDNTEHFKSTQVTPPPRPVSEFSPTSPKSSEFSNSRLPQPSSPPPRPVVSIADVMSTPPNSPSTPNISKRESWKILGWAKKKTFKEKDDEKEKNNNSTENTSDNGFPVQDTYNPFNVEKKLPAIPGKQVSRAKSRSKLHQDSTKSMLRVDSNDMNDNENSFSDNTSLDESLTLSPPPISNRPPPTVEDDFGDDDDDDGDISSPLEENAGENSSNEDNEDTETIYIESQEEDYDETVDGEGNSSNRTRRKGSFVGSIKVVEIGDRPKSPSGSDKDIEIEINEEQEHEEEEDIESGEDNAKKLEMYLQTPVKSCFGENIHEQNSEDVDQKSNDAISRKRQSFTTKFYSGSHITANGGRNNLVDALTKIMGNPEGDDDINEGNEKGTNNEDEIKKALKVLGGVTNEMISKKCEANVEDEQQLQLLLSPNTITNKNRGKKISKHDKAEQVKEDTNESIIINEKIVEKGIGLGITVDDKAADNVSDADEPITRSNTFSTDNEDCIMKDVIMLSDLLEKMLATYNKATSNEKNESIAKLLFESLKGMMEDIQKGIGIDEDNKQKQQQQQPENKTSTLVKTPEIITDHDDEGDLESNVSYTTALTTNGVQYSPPSILSPLPEISTPSSPLPSKSEKQQEQSSEDHTQNLLLEKYSDLLVKMVEEKISKINTPSPSNNEFTILNGNTPSVTSPILSNGINSSSSNSRPTKSRSLNNGGIPVGIGRPKTSKSSK